MPTGSAKRHSRRIDPKALAHIETIRERLPKSIDTALTIDAALMGTDETVIARGLMKMLGLPPCQSAMFENTRKSS